MVALASPLDQTSRGTIARFGIKVAVAALLACVSQAGYVITAAAWLSVFGLAVAAIAVIGRQRFSPSSFTCCDEAIWLMFGSHALRLVHLWMA